ncbi:hypothetical protein H3H37_12565 [Duganella sp. LX20W]|uniref:Uncharacterized protein n=1 Tax=Rugamonas brunnea TaxID=2758569 RepID=A0A7W2ICE0_9BURK|nr:hypothetical protein [Rugamonas brunnea]MBA5637887.1 hypothetical protein [Rugamonas brunnea]
MNELRRVLWMAVALFVMQLEAYAASDATPQSVEALRQQGYTVKNIAPIFGQLLMTAFPPGFTTVFEKTNGGHYIREAVLQGETVDKWTEMLTITADKGLAANVNLSPQKFAEIKAGGFKNACPTSFNAKVLGEGKISGYDGFVVVLSCGTSPASAGETSESTLEVIIKGESDYYTIQWAKRDEKSATPIDIKPAEWTQRFHLLAPIKLCPIIPGEAAPYPSCIDQK